MNVIHTRAFDSTPLPLVREAIDWQQRSVVVYGKAHPQPRLTRWYGPRPYPYSGLTWPAAPFPGVLLELAEKVSQAAGVRFDSVLCNLYRDGQDCVGWHADDEPLFGPDPVVASLSYGAAGLSRRVAARPRASSSNMAISSSWGRASNGLPPLRP